mmetsp:Transcript_1637/g.2722  ORF Transcript_1637/g.2722 Transcript_1637/m.2722 type:complete len:208 (+) Transcript_1637:435-1058(+)
MTKDRLDAVVIFFASDAQDHDLVYRFLECLHIAVGTGFTADVNGPRELPVFDEFFQDRNCSRLCFLVQRQDHVHEALLTVSLSNESCVGVDCFSDVSKQVGDCLVEVDLLLALQILWDADFCEQAVVLGRGTRRDKTYEVLGEGLKPTFDQTNWTQYAREALHLLVVPILCSLLELLKHDLPQVLRAELHRPRLFLQHVALVALVQD